MKGGVLEVLLVNATGLRHSHLMGSSAFYVTLKCGNQVYRSKVSSGKNGHVSWNDQFSFSFATEWSSLRRLKIKIMKIHTFNEDSPVGEASIHLGGVLEEGKHRGSIELSPSPYNVVLPDGTYEGEIRIGLKFTSDIEVRPAEKKTEEPEAGTERSRTIYGALLRYAIARFSWSRIGFFWKRGSSKEGKSEKNSKMGA